VIGFRSARPCSRLPLSRAGTIFRFLRRARFTHSTATALLEATLKFRLSLPNPNTLPPNPYYSTPTFFFHPSLHDRFGRPAGVLNLRHVRRAQDGSLDALKDFVRERWEEGRQLLAKQSEEKAEPCLQLVLIVDLEGAGMANLVSGAAAAATDGWRCTEG
jgi:hypothetical protein